MAISLSLATGFLLQFYAPGTPDNSLLSLKIQAALTSAGLDRLELPSKYDKTFKASLISRISKLPLTTLQKLCTEKNFVRAQKVERYRQLQWFRTKFSIILAGDALSIHCKLHLLPFFSSFLLTTSQRSAYFNYFMNFLPKTLKEKYLSKTLNQENITDPISCILHGLINDFRRLGINKNPSLFFDLETLPDASEIALLDACLTSLDLEHAAAISDLKTIVISDHPTITTLPAWINMLTSLEILFLCDCNDLTSLPSQLGDLSHLRMLYIFRCNSLFSLPSTFLQLVNLEDLIFFACQRLTYPINTLIRLPKLAHLEVSDCNMENLACNIF